MLTAKNCQASAAVKYFTDDYERGETRWFGKGAAKLGLVGEIERESFEHICYGRSPDGSKYLGTKGNPDKRRAGTDFTFSAPKSVSLTALVSGDTRLEVAHRNAVEMTLKLIEARYAQTRITKNGIVSEIQTGNLVVAQFDHIESRELDPHLHTHALVMNLTQAESGKWYANDNDRIFQNKKHLGTIYQAYLAAEVERQGYEIEPRPHGMFEIKGYKRENLVEFSKRRMQILAQCPADSTWQTREDSWHRTRKNKERVPSIELKARWQQEASDLGIEIVRSGLPIVAPPISTTVKHRSLDDAIAHCSERSVDFRVEDIEKFIIAQRLPLDLAEIKSLCDNRPDLIKRVGVASLKENRYYTTFKAQIQAEVSDWIQGESSIDSLDESEAELDKQKSVKVPTHGGGVRVPIFREDELDTTPVR
ncbi:MobF family relaxase [Chamaesiphon sp.]|uniref:MobF family relaxase n=1 Tax=Chamaesiphon sp. TaxID=2814140 RepID=UPI003593D30B